MPLTIKLKVMHLFYYFLLTLQILLGSAKNVSKQKGNNLESKVVGGTPVDITKFPFAVIIFNLVNMCGGTIINTRLVLTAAHCFDFNKNVEEMRIQAGSRYMIFDRKAKSYDVIDFMIHQNYNRSIIFSCDVAIVVVDRKFKFGPTIAKATLVNHNKWMTGKEKNFLAAGWGRTMYQGQLSQEGLLNTHLSFIPLKRCMEMHKLKFTKDMFCLYGEGKRDACMGDSGGSIVWNGMIVGVISHGDGCATLNKPSLHANVWYFRKWIDVTSAKLIQKYCKTLNKKLC